MFVYFSEVGRRGEFCGFFEFLGLWNKVHVFWILVVLICTICSIISLHHKIESLIHKIEI